MWIITQHSGVINTNAVTRFIEHTYGTFAQCGNASYNISEDRILTTIVEALKSGQDFLEVE